MAVDLVMRPESDALLRAIPLLKERLRLNVELASPDRFPAMSDRGLITAAGVREMFVQMEPLRYRSPAVDPPSLRRAVDEMFAPR
jgi:hypothetical protein